MLLGANVNSVKGDLKIDADGDEASSGAKICLRACKKCNAEKPDTEFYAKENTRRDKICIACRKSAKREKYRGIKAVPCESPKAVNSGSVEEGIEVSSIEKESIVRIAEVFLLLEQWQTELNAQEEISNPKTIKK
jgi:hypothetical protein